jgi:GMP synthase-like glutamine amidotransferase
MNEFKVTVLNNTTFSALGYLEHYFKARDVLPTIINTVDLGTQEWDEIEPADLLILLGSPASVNDKEPWIESLIDYTSKQLALEQPILGICFGAQIVGSVAGAEISRMASTRIGFQDVDQGGSNPWSGSWMCFHEEFVSPNSHIQLVSVEAEIPYAFRYGSAIAIQFHPEMNREVVLRIIDSLERNSPYAPQLAQCLPLLDDEYKARFFEFMDRLLVDEFGFVGRIEVAQRNHS